jgi:hypothetical protein
MHLAGTATAKRDRFWYRYYAFAYTYLRPRIFLLDPGIQHRAGVGAVIVRPRLALRWLWYCKLVMPRCPNCHGVNEDEKSAFKLIRIRISDLG